MSPREVETFSVSVRPEIVEKLNELAKRFRWSRSQVVGELVHFHERVMHVCDDVENRLEHDDFCSEGVYRLTHDVVCDGLLGPVPTDADLEVEGLATPTIPEELPVEGGGA